MSKSKNGEKGKVTTGVVTALAVCALLCGTYALLVKYEKLPESSADIIISASIAISAVLGSIIATFRRGGGGGSGLIVGCIFAAILCAVPLAAYSDNVNWLRILRIFFISAAGGFLGGALNLCKSNKSFHKSRK